MSDDDVGALPFCHLTTTGRHSGLPHRIEIWFARQADVVYLLSGDRDRADWVRNLAVSPDVVLELGECRGHRRARIVEADSEEDALARRLLVEKYQPHTTDDLTDWGRTALPVAIDWP